MTRNVRAVPEDPVRLTVNGGIVATWSCSPDALEALGAGRLLTLGFIRDRRDLLELDVPGATDGILRIEARVAPERAMAAAAERDHRRAHGCGLRYLVDCRSDLLPARGPAAAGAPGADAARELFRELMERSPSRQGAGGHHTAALSDGERLVYVFEEVGRHNAADKVIGAALLDDVPLERHGLVTSARISGEMAEKAARAGLGWVASRSVPTTLAVAIAAAARVPLLARAPSPDARLFDPGVA